MAGFGKDERYYLPRSRCVPCDELRRRVFPWLETVFDTLDRSEAQGNRHPTARLTFQYYRELRDVILQDVAAMLLSMDSEDPLRDHNIFKLPVFVSDLFVEFVAKMNETLAEERGKKRDKGSRAIDQLLPGVNRKFEEVNRKLEEVTRTMEELKIESEAVKAAANAAAASAVEAKKSAELALTAARVVMDGQVSVLFCFSFLCLVFSY